MDALVDTLTKHELAATAAALDQMLTFHEIAPPERRLDATDWTHAVHALRKVRQALDAAERIRHVPYQGPTNHDEREEYEAEIHRRTLRERKRRNARAATRHRRTHDPPV